MKRSPREIVIAHTNDILSAIIYIQNFVSGMTLSEFLTDKNTTYAVTRSLDTICRKASLISLLRRQNREIAIPHLPYRYLRKATRKLNHNYNEINPEILWYTIERDLEELEDSTRRFLKDHVDDSVPIRVFKYPKVKLISSTKEFELTQDTLSETIMPFMTALGELQSIIDQVNQNPPSTIKIQSLSQNSPVGIALDGVADAIKVFIDTIVPWRREHAKQMAKHEEELKLIQIEISRAEVLEKRAIAHKERAEAQKLEMEIQEKRTDLALKVLSQFPRACQETQKIYLVNQLLKPLGILAESSISLELPHEPRR